MAKLQNFKLRKVTLSPQEKDDLVNYCSNLGYVLDTEPKEFNGKIPVIRKGINDKRKGYIQRVKGVLWWVYSQKRENLSTVITLQKKLDKNHVSHKKRIFRFFTGITDFEFINDYRND